MTMNRPYIAAAIGFIFFGTIMQSAAQTEDMNGTAIKHDLTITRVFDAPIEAVWKAWSDAELVKQWWGPHGFTAPVAEMDFREGGSSFVCMYNPDFGMLCNRWYYTRIVPMERIEFTQKWADVTGNVVDSEKAGVGPGLPNEVPHEISFKDLDGGTTQLTVSEFGYPSIEIVERSKAGMEQCLEKMAEIISAE